MNFNFAVAELISYLEKCTSRHEVSLNISAGCSFDATSKEFFQRLIPISKEVGKIHLIFGRAANTLQEKDSEFSLRIKGTIELVQELIAVVNPNQVFDIRFYEKSHKLVGSIDAITAFVKLIRAETIVQGHLKFLETVIPETEISQPAKRSKLDLPPQVKKVGLRALYAEKPSSFDIVGIDFCFQNMFRKFGLPLDLEFNDTPASRLYFIPISHYENITPEMMLCLGTFPFFKKVDLLYGDSEKNFASHPQVLIRESQDPIKKMLMTDGKVTEFFTAVPSVSAGEE